MDNWYTQAGGEDIHDFHQRQIGGLMQKHLTESIIQ